MEKSLIGNAIVIINSGIDPQTFNSYWLVKNGILKEEELSNEHIFTNQIVQLNFENFNIVINMNSFQFILKNNQLDNYSQLLEKAKKLIDLTNYIINISVGINFNWILKLPLGDYRGVSKKLFYVSDSNIFKDFDKDEACFGSYMSRDFEHSRLKLDIKPILLSNDKEDGAIAFNFNFHLDLPDENKNNILKNYIQSWETYFIESKRTIDALEL